MINKIKCIFLKHVWFFKQSGGLIWAECDRCGKEIYPVGEDYNPVNKTATEEKMILESIKRR